MAILRQIINRLYIIAVKYSDAQNYTLSLIESVYRRGEVELIEKPLSDNIDDFKEILTKNPVIVIIYGYGVISKDFDSSNDIISKVTNESDKFIWCKTSDLKISLVRREQVAEISKKLSDRDIKVFDFTPVTDDLTSAAKLKAEEFFRTELTIKRLVTPTLQGSILANIFCTKVRLPLLVSVLVLLGVNYYINGNIRERYQSLHTKLTSLEQKQGKERDMSTQREKLMVDYSVKLPYSYAIICDRIAATLPKGVVLSMVAIQPLVKPLESQKQVILSQKQIVIKGESSNSDEISEYSKVLQREFFVKNLKMVSLQRDSESGLYIFQIDIDI